MSVFLRDDFSGSGAIGAPNWGNAATGFFGGDISHFGMAGGFLTVLTPSGGGWDGAANCAVTPPSADYYAEAQCAFPASMNSIVTLGLRSNYYVTVTWVDATHVSTQVIVHSTSAQLDGTLPVTRAVTAAASIDIRFEIQGTTLRLKFDGVTVWTGTDATTSSAGWPFIDVPRTGTVYASLDWFEAGTFTASPFWTDFVKSAET